MHLQVTHVMEGCVADVQGVIHEPSCAAKASWQEQKVKPAPKTPSESSPAVFDVPANRPSAAAPPAIEDLSDVSSKAGSYDDDFEDGFEEDSGPTAPAPPPPVELASPASPPPSIGRQPPRAGRRAGLSAVSAGPLDWVASEPQAMPRGHGAEERARVAEEERQRQDRVLREARAEAERLEMDAQQERVEAKRHTAGRSHQADTRRKAASKEARSPVASPVAPTTDEACEGQRLTALARENSELEASLSRARRELEQLRKQNEALASRACPPRSAGGSRPSSRMAARGTRGASKRPPSSAGESEREARLAQNARKQLDYYAREHEHLRRQLGRLAQADDKMDSMRAVIRAKTEAVSAAVRRGKELTRAQKEAARELGSPQREDPARALSLLREEVRVLKERQLRAREQVEAFEKDGRSHEARVAEAQRSIDNYSTRLKAVQGKLHSMQQAASAETEAAERQAQARAAALDAEREEEETAMARERADQRAMVNDLVAQIKQGRAGAKAAAAMSKAAKEKLRVLELQRKQMDRARREARVAQRQGQDRQEIVPEADEAAAELTENAQQMDTQVFGSEPDSGAAEERTLARDFFDLQEDPHASSGPHANASGRSPPVGIDPNSPGGASYDCSDFEEEDESDGSAT
mmetsp:Transcript_32751/g.103070  ORF Transcript_32751/g.103070 Transcript_32751/m.103070 type:complete len:642 (+) Transcript_32751:66-1991(+)